MEEKIEISIKHVTGEKVGPASKLLYVERQISYDGDLVYSDRLCPELYLSATDNLSEFYHAENIGYVKLNETVEVPHNSGDILLVRTKFFNETLAKNIHNPKLAKTIEIATRFDDWMPSMVELPQEQGRHHPCMFRVFEGSFDNHRILMKSKVHKEGNLVYYMRILPNKK